MSYKVVKDKVIHNCPTCGIDLENPLKQAGQNDTCPQCGKSFVVPGEKELREEMGRKAALELKEKALQKIQKDKEVKEAQEAQAASQAAAARKVAKKDAERILISNIESILGVPEYKSLRAVGTLFIITGCISIIIGFVLFMIGIAIATSGNDTIFTAQAFIILVLGVLNGIVCIGMGQAIFALRDIAINSFHSANSLRLIARSQEK